MAARPCRLDELRCEALDSPVDGDVIDVHSTLGQQLLDVTAGQAVPQVPPHRHRDHLARESETSERGGRGRAHDTILVPGPIEQRNSARHRMSESATPEVDVEELAIARESGVLVDAREPDEYASGHVPGAVLIPMAQLTNRLGEIDKTSLVFVICASETGAVP